jgi:hypothetical protein
MITISRQQLQALSTAQEQRFIARGVAHLRQHHAGWCGKRDDKDLAALVRAMVTFARDHGVKQAHNVLMLIDLQVRLRFAVPLTSYLRYRLTQRGFDEDTRVHHFAWALSQPDRPVVISLATDLDALERADG